MSADDSHSDREYNEQLVRRYWEECRNEGNFELIDEIFADDHVGHGFGGSESWEGIEGIRDFIEMDHRAFPDAYYDIQDLFATEDKVTTRWVFHGTHNGEMEIYDSVIEPTGNEVAIPGVVIDKIRDGEIAETWVTVDSLTVMQQLDVVPEDLL